MTWYLQYICDRLLDASIAAAPEPSGNWAIDGTGVDTWANGLKPVRRRSDQDARWGHRTATPQKSMSDKFFGYDLYGFTIVPPAGGDGHTHPNLTGRIVVRPAASDDAEASLTGIDSLLNSGVPVERVLVDRGISYKADERWARELRDRGIDQTLDMHASEHGRLGYDGVAMIDGWPHCPSIPETLVHIKRPERLSVPSNGADNPELEQFRESVAERGRFAMRRTQGWTEKKRTGERVERYECPAEAGFVRCPLKPASMLVPRRRPPELEPTGSGGGTRVLYPAHHRAARASTGQAPSEAPLGIRRVDQGTTPDAPTSRAASESSATPPSEDSAAGCSA